MSKELIPQGWGDDGLSSFINDARQNSFHTFAHVKEWYERLRKINDVFLKVVGHLDQAEPWFATFFIPRAHSAYLASVRLGISGQLPEAHTVLRCSLENALYGFHVSVHPEEAETFLRKQDDEKWLKKFRKEFRPASMFSVLAKKDQRTAEIGRELNERCIEQGAHPNMSGLLTNLAIRQEGKREVVTTDYFTRDDVVYRSCLKTIAQTGVCVLRIVCRMFPERFAILGLSEIIDNLSEGL